MNRSLVALSGAALVACGAPTSAARPEVPPAPAPVVTPPAPAQSPAPVEVPLAGVDPGGAEGRAARRQAVLAMLSDGTGAAALEVAAVDPGRSFNPHLADDLTPMIVVSRGGPSMVLQGAPRVDGPLEKDIVRRIVRAHINEVRHCYNQGLTDDPRLAGAVTVDFEILESGSVDVGALHSSTVHDREVGECIVTAVKRWRFPRPGGVVKVSYPFRFAPAQ